jgi:hypothetical protein
MSRAKAQIGHFRRISGAIVLFPGREMCSYAQKPAQARVTAQLRCSFIDLAAVESEPLL